MAHQGPFLTPRLQSDRQDLHDIVMPSPSASCPHALIAMLQSHALIAILQSHALIATHQSPALIALHQSHVLIAAAEHLVVAMTTPPHCLHSAAPDAWMSIQGHSLLPPTWNILLGGLGPYPFWVAVPLQPSLGLLYSFLLGLFGVF